MSAGASLLDSEAVEPSHHYRKFQWTLPVSDRLLSPRTVDIRGQMTAVGTEFCTADA